MAPNTKRVFYVRYLPSAIYPKVLERRADVQLDKLETDSPDDVVAPILAQAHVYQIGASRQIIPLRLQANAALLEQAPNLIVAICKHPRTGSQTSTCARPADVCRLLHITKAHQPITTQLFNDAVTPTDIARQGDASSLIPYG